MSHQSQLFSREANSVECLTIRVHLASESPNPDNAPYRAAIVWQKHISSRKPIQLNRNATVSERIWMTLLVRERERKVITVWVVCVTDSEHQASILTNELTYTQICKSNNTKFTEYHQVTHRWDSLQIWRVAANILTKQSQTADKGRSSSLAVGWRANNSSTCHNIKWCSFAGCLQYIFIKCSSKIWQSLDQPPQNWKCVIRYYDLNKARMGGKEICMQRFQGETWNTSLRFTRITPTSTVLMLQTHNLNLRCRLSNNTPITIVLINQFPKLLLDISHFLLINH